MSASVDQAIPREHFAWLACPFRPFFLLAAMYAVLAMAAWAAFLFGGLRPPAHGGVFQWHAHELLYGMVPAAVAGFLLTAMANWTGAPALRGLPLLALIALWAAGRAAMWSAGMLPAAAVAVMDVAFLPVLAAYAARVLLRHGNRRNLVLAAMLVVLAAGNVAMHLDFAGRLDGGARAGEIIALDIVAVMMIVIGGRITPSFTSNWLRRRGADADAVRTSAPLDTLAMVLALVMVPADLAGPTWLAAVVAGAAALVNGWRLWLWRGWRARIEPLLWILHLGMAWIVVALSLKALAPLVAAVPPTAWMHALGAGAMATLILGVMTRVAVGHTGRPLVLARGGIILYLAVIVAGLARLGAALGIVDQRAALVVAVAGWMVAFGGFAVLYWSILTRPRPDGRPG